MNNELEYLRVARFAGPDAGPFLHAQLSADIEALQPGGATLAAYCNPKGQVLGVLMVCRDSEGYLVAAARDLLGGILQRLRLYVLRSNVTFEVADSVSAYGLPSPDADAPGGCVCSPGPERLHYGISESVPTGSLEPVAFKAREISLGLSWLGTGTTGRFIPQMLGLDGLGAVSFSKGCYPGQEIVARARYLGKVKRRPLVLNVTAVVETSPGDRVRVHRGEEWSEAVVVDLARGDGEETRMLLVTTEAEAAPDTIELDGSRYGCATM